MANNFCPQCGAPLDLGASECKFCGERQVVQQAAPQPQPVYGQQPRTTYAQQSQPAYVQQPQPQVVIQQPMPQPVYVMGINPSWPVKSKIAAGVLALFLGGLGVHKFYLGKVGMGILYLCFCWTGIPAVVAFIEGIIYLCSNDENFQLKNHVRIE